MLEEDKDILKNKKSFVLFCDKRKTVESMTDEDAGKLFKAIYQYQDEGKHELTGLLNTVFETFIPAFNANDEKYIATAKRNRINGAKGGRPRKEENPNKPKQTQTNPMGFLETQTNPKNLDTDTDTDTDIKNKNIFYIEEKQKFKKPTLEEIKKYSIEQDFTFDCEYFYDYWESVDWCRGKTKIKDWKATARNWENRQNKTQKDKGQEELKQYELESYYENA